MEKEFNSQGSVKETPGVRPSGEVVSDGDLVRNLGENPSLGTKKEFDYFDIQRIMNGETTPEEIIEEREKELKLYEEATGDSYEQGDVLDEIY